VELRVGVTGHIDLSPETARLVAEALHDHLREVRDRAGARSRVVGVSCLAPGADSVFAEVLLGLGGRLEVIIPSADYRETQVGPDHAPTFEGLLRRADRVWTAPCERAEPASYAAANDAMLATIDHLVAVWDGNRSVQLGGTAHAVQTAELRRIPISVVWPEGAQRA
jgi:hypothetical protein